MSSNEPNDPLAELLGSLRSGETRGGVGNLADLLGALTQGGAVTGQASGAPEAGGLADMLGQMSQAGGAPQVEGGQPGGMPQSGDALGQMLGSLLGGGAQGSTPSMGAPASTPQGTTGIGDILGAVLGGGSTSIGASPLLAPIADLLAQKLGLPPAIAQAVLAFVLAKLVSGSSGGGPAGRMDLVPEGPGMQDLLVQASSGQRLDKLTLASTGLPEELAQHTGLDVDTASKSLQQALKLLGPAVGGLGTAQ